MRHLLGRLFFTPARHLCRGALRIILAGLIFTTCLMVVSRHLGLPVPSPYELLDKFAGVAQLAEILS